MYSSLQCIVKFLKPWNKQILRSQDFQGKEEIMSIRNDSRDITKFQESTSKTHAVKWREKPSKISALESKLITAHWINRENQKEQERQQKKATKTSKQKKITL